MIEEKSPLAQAYEKLLQAICPEDIFGDTANSRERDEARIKKIFRRLSQSIHPDFYADHHQNEMAKNAFQILNELHEQALKNLEQGIYGQRIAGDQNNGQGFSIKTQKREYFILSALASGDLASIYRGVVVGTTGPEGQIVVKIVDDVGNNDLAAREIQVLRIFQNEPSPQSKHLPVILDNFKTTASQHGVVLRYFDGYDLYSVREQYPQGLDPRHVSWILARSLSAIGYVHSQDIIHGNIEPAHILVRPRDHNVYLCDWSYACINPLIAGDGFKVLNEPYSPPEVAARKSPLPASDLYSLGKTMIYLLGGDPKTGSMPASTPAPFKQLLKAMTLKSALQRPRDAWELYRYLEEVRTKIWGEKRFLELKMNTAI